MAAVLTLGEKAERFLLQTFYSVREYNLKSLKKKWKSSVLWLLMFANAYGTHAAYTFGDYASAFACLMTIVGIALWMFCLPSFSSMTDTQINFARLILWVITTAIFFGYAYQFQNILPLPVTLALYTFALVASAFSFYVTTIGNSLTMGFFNQRLDAEEEELKAVDSSLEKV